MIVAVNVQVEKKSMLLSYYSVDFFEINQMLFTFVGNVYFSSTEIMLQRIIFGMEACHKSWFKLKGKKICSVGQCGFFSFCLLFLA